MKDATAVYRLGHPGTCCLADRVALHFKHEIIPVATRGVAMSLAP